MKHLLVIPIFFLGSMLLTAQNKPPVALDDHISTQAGVPVTVNVLENDFCVFGNSIKIFIAGNPGHGFHEYSDSTITYTPHSYYSGVDSITYIIQDQNSQLFSEGAKLYITVNNNGFSWLDINNWYARINVFGNHFWDFDSFRTSEIPTGSGCGTIFNSAFWIGGYDEQGSLHLAAERYRRNYFGRPAMDFRPGPVMDSLCYSFEQDTLWNRVWKLNRSSIEYHKNHWWKSGYSTPLEITNWPGNGDVNLGQSQQLAPYFDRNKDGLYDPYDGDYPLIRGDQAIFFIFNDDRDFHTSSGGRKMKIEIHGMAYGFECTENEAFHNTIFLLYKIFNRSYNTYSETYLGFYNDFDLGYPNDDYIETDVARNSLIAFNSEEIDGFGQEGSYGNYPPAQSITLLSGPPIDPDGFDNPSMGQNGTPLCSSGYNGSGFGDGIIDNERYGITGSLAFSTFYWIGFYQNPEEVYSHFAGQWRDGSHLLYGGSGHVGENGYGPACRFIFPGTSDNVNWGTGCELPNGPVDWTVETAGIEPGDFNNLLSSGPFTFKPGESFDIEVAFIYARDEENPDTRSSFNLLKNHIDYIKWNYSNDTTPCGGNFSDIKEEIPTQSYFNLYPNPANNKITINLPKNNDKISYQIYDIMGRIVLEGMINNKNEINVDISVLSDGFYLIQIKSTNHSSSLKFIKN